MNSSLFTACFLFLAFFNAPVQAQSQTVTCIQTESNSTIDFLNTNINNVVQGATSLSPAEIALIQTSLVTLTNGIQTEAQKLMEKAVECSSSTLLQRAACWVDFSALLSNGILTLMANFITGLAAVQDRELVNALAGIVTPALTALPLNLLRCVEYLISG